MKTKKGVLTAVMAFLIASMAFSMTALTMSLGVAKNTFTKLDTTNDAEWIKTFLVDNMKSVCKQNNEDTIPRNGYFTTTLKGVERIGIYQKELTGKEKIFLRLDYGSGRTNEIKVEQKGYINSDYACDNSPGAYEINHSGSHTGETADQSGEDGWVSVNGDKPINFRVMEESGGNWVNLEVTQN